MADGTDDQLYQLTNEVNRLVKLLGGGGYSPFSSSGTSKPKNAGLGASGANTGLLGKGMKSLHGSVKLMHGGFEDMLSVVETVVSKLGVLGVAAGGMIALFEGAMKLSKTYSKMTDIGQTFGGSMLNMAAQAGRAGLSLHEFAELQSRNSVLTMMMNEVIVDSTRNISQTVSSTTATISGMGARMHTVVSTSGLNAAHRNLGTTLNHAGTQIRGLGQTAGTVAASRSAAGLQTAFDAAATTADEVRTREAAMADAVGHLTQMLAGAAGSSAMVRMSMTSLRAEQAKSENLAADYRKHLGESSAAFTSLTAAQGMLDGLTTSAGSEMARLGQSTQDVASKQAATEAIMARLNAAIGEMGTSATQMAIEQGATASQAAQLNDGLGAVAGTSAAVAGQQSDLSAQTSEFSKQTAAAAATAAQMSARLGNVSAQTALFTRQIDTAAVNAQGIAQKQRGMASTVDALNKQFTDVQSATAGIVISQSAAGSATEQYTNAAIKVQAAIKDLTAVQAEAGTATASVTRNFTDVAGTANDMKKNQEVTNNLTGDMNRSIHDTSVAFNNLSQQQNEVGKAGQRLRAALDVARPGETADPTVRLREPLARFGAGLEAVSGAQTLLNDSTSSLNSGLLGLTTNSQRLAAASGMSQQSTLGLATSTEAANRALGATADAAQKQAQQTKSDTEQMVKDAASSKRAHASTLAQLQLEVRNDLETVGFFGMSLSELTGATSDYMETIRQGGMLYRLDNLERKKAVETMLSDVTTMSAVWGKSREAIMKTTNEAMRQVNYAASMIGADKARVDAGEKWISMFAAIPGQTGDKLAAMFAEQAGRGGYIDTELGKGFIETGMGNLNAIFGRGTEMLKDSIGGNAEVQGQILSDAYDELSANRERLQNLTHDPALRKYAEEQLRMLSDMQGRFVVDGKFSQQLYVQAQQEAEKNKKRMDVLTKNMLVFTSSFQQITGGFLEGFYGALAEMMGGGDSQTFKDTMETLRAAFVKLGRGVGTVLGILMSPTSISVLTVLFTWFDNLVTVVSTVIDWMSKLVESLTKAVDWIRSILPSWMGMEKKEVERNQNGSIKGNAQLAQELHGTDRAALAKQAADTTNPDRDKAQKQLRQFDELNKNVLGWQEDAQKKLQEQASSSNPDAISRQKAQEQIKYNAENPNQEIDWSAYIAAQDKKDRSSAVGIAESAGVVIGGLVALKAAKVFWRLFKGTASLVGLGGGKGGKGAVAGALGAAAGLGDGCCNSITGGLGEIGKKIDEHGGTAAKNAEAAVKAGEKEAETLAASVAKKAPIMERAGLGVATAAHGVWDTMKTGGSMLYKGIGGAADAVLDAPKAISGAWSAGKAAVSGAAKGAMGGIKGFGTKALGTVTGSIAGIASKGLLKGIGSALPLIGLGMGGVFAAQRALQGDLLGAGLELVGGVASLVPGIGTAIDVGVQGALFTRDMIRANSEAKDKDKEKDGKTADGLPLDVGPRGPENKDNPGASDSQAEADLRRLQTMRTDLIDKTNLDKEDGNVAEVSADTVLLQKMNDGIAQLTALASKSNQAQSDSNQIETARQANAVLAGIP